MTGILQSSLPATSSADPAQALAEAASLGLGACLFPTMLHLSATLDGGALAAARAAADDLGLSLAAGAGWINPFHLERCRPVCALGDGDFLAGLRQVVAAAAAIGISELFFMVGLIDDRFDRSIPWAGQLEATASLLRRFAPVLRDHGVRLLVKTHEEITSFEIARLVVEVGPDMLGVALDPVNLLVRIEDPVEATKRIAPYVRQVFLDDAVVRFAEGGLRRFLHPLGQGDVDCPAILALVPKGAAGFVELHRGQFAMPIFDPTWRQGQPDMPLREFAAIVGLAARASSREMAWDQAVPLSRLQPTLDALRSLAS